MPKVRSKISLKIKQELLRKHDEGFKICALSREYNFPQSTISSIVKRKQVLERSNACDESVRIHEGREAIDEMEKILLLWLKDKQISGDVVSSQQIRDRAKQIFDDIKATTPSTSETRFTGFKASKGWFDRFKKRVEAINYSESDSTGTLATEGSKSTQDSREILEKKGYLGQQIFHVIQTGIFWKRLPKRTEIAQEEALKPGHKPMKDRISLLLAANTTGDFKVKPMVIYHSENPRAFKKHKVIKSRLGVFWRCNKKSRMTKHLFHEWAAEIFCPSVKTYLEKQKLPRKALLLLRNAPGHDPDLVRSLEAEFDFLSVKFLPAPIAGLLQRRNTQVSDNFKKIYTKKMLQRCVDEMAGTDLGLKEFWKNKFNILDCVRLLLCVWNEVAPQYLSAAWKNLSPASVTELRRLDSESHLVTDIVTIAGKLGMELETKDVEEWIAEHGKELSAEEAKELEKSGEKEIAMEDDLEEDHLPTAEEIRDMLGAWQMFKKTVRKNPDIETTELMICQFEDKVLSYFRNLQKKRESAIAHVVSSVMEVANTTQLQRIEVEVYPEYDGRHFFQDVIDAMPNLQVQTQWTPVKDAQFEEANNA